MANKRELKKEIDRKSYEVVSDCMTHGLLHPEHKESSEKIMKEALQLREDLLKRTNNYPQDTEVSAGSYYRKIRQDLIKEAHEKLKELSKLVQKK